MSTSCPISVPSQPVSRRRRHVRPPMSTSSQATDAQCTCKLRPIHNYASLAATSPKCTGVSSRPRSAPWATRRHASRWRRSAQTWKRSSLAVQGESIYINTHALITRVAHQVDSYPSTMFACNTPHDEAPWQRTLGCTSMFTPTVTLTSITVSWNDIIGSLSRTTETEGGMNAYSVQVRLRSGDFQTVTTVTKTVHTSTTTTLPVPGVTTTIPARDVDFLSPSALAAAACTVALFLIGILAGSLCFYLGRTDRRREARVLRNEREGRPLLGNDSVGYRSTERGVPRPKDPPPPYQAGQSSRAGQS